MHVPLHPPLRSLRLDPLDPGDADVLLASARQLQQSALPSGAASRPLRGKNLGLLCDSVEAGDATLFGSRQSHSARTSPTSGPA